MNALNSLFLRLILEQPKIVLNSQSGNFIQQLAMLRAESESNPVKASKEEIRSLVFVLPDVNFPPFSFSDISNVWNEKGFGWYIQFRKIRKSFCINENLGKTLLGFKDLGYWSSDHSFSQNT